MCDRQHDITTAFVCSGTEIVYQTLLNSNIAEFKLSSLPLEPGYASGTRSLLGSDWVSSKDELLGIRATKAWIP